VLEPFQLPFVQRGLIEVLILAVPAGLLGTWIVLRGLAFFSHAVGTAAFPGLVLADGLGFAAPLGAFAAAIVFSVGASLLSRRDEEGRDSAVAIVLVGCLAAGVILASDVFGSTAATSRSRRSQPEPPSSPRCCSVIVGLRSASTPQRLVPSGQVAAASTSPCWG
jgi:ABC-type Mn2+/Zn2+ transport system permease subunit